MVHSALSSRAGGLLALLLLTSTSWPTVAQAQDVSVAFPTGESLGLVGPTFDRGGLRLTGTSQINIVNGVGLEGGSSAQRIDEGEVLSITFDAGLARRVSYGTFAVAGGSVQVAEAFDALGQSLGTVSYSAGPGVYDIVGGASTLPNVHVSRVTLTNQSGAGFRLGSIDYSPVEPLTGGALVPEAGPALDAFLGSYEDPRGRIFTLVGGAFGLRVSMDLPKQNRVGTRAAVWTSVAPLAATWVRKATGQTIVLRRAEATEGLLLHVYDQGQSGARPDAPLRVVELKPVDPPG